MRSQLCSSSRGGRRRGFREVARGCERVGGSQTPDQGPGLDRPVDITPLARSEAFEPQQ